ATFRPAEGKGRHDGVATLRQRGVQPRDIGGAVYLLSKKMEGGAVVPHVVSPLWLPSSHVRNDPFDAIGVTTTRRLRPRDRLRREVKDSDVAETQAKRMGGKARSPTTHVDQRVL